MRRNRAKLLASLNAKSPLLLFMGRTATIAGVVTASYQTHKCTACHTEVAFGAPTDEVQPFCVACGGSMVPTGEVVQVAPQEEQLTSVGCPSCSTQNVVEDRMANVLGGKMHCAACTKDITFVASSDDADGVVDTDIEEEDLREDQLNAGAEDEAEIEKEHDDASDSDNDGEELKNDEDREGTEQAGAAADSADAVAKGAAAAADAARQAEDAENGGAGEDLSPLGDDDLDIDLAALADDDGELEIKLDEDEDGEEARLLAFVDGVHCMTLNKEHAGENADLIVQSGFHAALQREASVKGNGVLASYGFKPVVVKAPIAKLVAPRVEVALKAERDTVAASLSDLTADFDQSAKIAAAALTHNFYRGKTNPLQDSLVATLEAGGVKQAKQMVKHALLASGSSFVEAMLQLAGELMQKPVEVRNELSDTLTRMNPEAAFAADESVDEDNDEMVEDEMSPSAVTARLTQGVTGLPRSRRNIQETAGAQSYSDLGAHLRALKGRR